MSAEVREGGCLCGAVRFTARLPHRNFGACHCEMCRRWTGSALLGISVPAENLVWRGEEQVARYQSSPWAMRAWCRTCGSHLYYRVTAPGPHSETYELPVGLLDDASGLTMTNEIYIDMKPDSWAFAGEDRHLMTRQACIDAFAAPASDQ